MTCRVARVRGKSEWRSDCSCRRRCIRAAARQSDSRVKSNLKKDSRPHLSATPFSHSDIIDIENYMIPDNIVGEIESELQIAFDASAQPFNEEKLHLVGNELHCYYPNDMLSVMPYVLLGCLRLDYRSVKNQDLLDFIVKYLNIRWYDYDSDTGLIIPTEVDELTKYLICSKEESVSLFTKNQARAIWHWLETMKNFKEKE
jgi:hypothetical protein